SNIKICAEALEMDDELDEELQKSYLNTISSEATRLSRFVDEFLNISRMEAGSLALNRHPTNLERLIGEALDKTRAQLDQKQIELHIHLPARLPELSLDKDKISAALVNLLGNAAKYTPVGGKVSLNVELAKSEIRVQVEDSGFGIAPEELGKVFNKFFRSDDQRIRDINGTGLGLSFAQEVVRLHGGSITVRSEVDKGSRFTMILPVA
ncbi:MAG: sensor histidine kinase, partial [Fuerstia sp.]|nr:sensor histidine kinase [Fuerstiella sp.]